LAQMSEALNFTEMVFASLSAMPFSWIQTLWYLYFCPRLNLVILLVNPPSIKVLIASTPCSNDASICPVEINSQNVAAVLRKIQMHPYKYRAIGTKSIQQLFNQKMWVLNNCADIDRAIKHLTINVKSMISLQATLKPDTPYLLE
jgi:hypothetical protein